MSEAPESLYSKEIIDNPLDTYRELRDHCPVAVRTAGRYGEVTLISRYDDIWALEHDPETFASSGALDLTGDGAPAIPITTDPPDHARYRRLLDPMFSPKQMRAFEPTVREHARKLIEGFVSTGSCDFYRDFGTPYPAELFMELVGFPKKDMGRMLGWQQVAVRVEEQIMGGGTESVSAMIEMMQTSGAECFGYFGDLADARAAEPADDLMTKMLNAEVEGESLTREEIQSICFTLMLGGLDTITSSLTVLVAWLAQHPDVRQGVIDDPETLPGLIEDLMRRESPVWVNFRRTAKETTLHGVTIPANTTIGVMLAAANTDESQFPDAESVIPGRKPNRHLVYGAGPHRCLGSHFARMQLRVALEELHKAIPDYRLPEGHELSYGGTSIRAVNPLPLLWNPA